MTLPTMTRAKHWFNLALLTVFEIMAILFSFLAGPPIAPLGLVLIFAIQVQWVGAIILALRHAGKT